MVIPLKCKQLVLYCYCDLCQKQPELVCVHVGGAGAPVSSPPVMELMNMKITVQYQ